MNRFLLFVVLLMPLTSIMALHDSKPDPEKEKSAAGAVNSTLRVGVIGLVHTHVHWILGREEQGDIEIVGIVEPNRKLAKEYSERHGYSMDIVFDTMEEMIAETKPEAVTAFNTIYGHLEVVEFCAP